MKKILVAAAMADFDQHDDAMTLLYEKAKDGTSVIPGLAEVKDGGIDWPAVRQAEGGWEGAYRWAAENHECVCVVPVDKKNGLSRGVFSIAAQTLRLGKPVLAYCAGRLNKVSGVDVVNPGEYKGVYGRFTLGG